eukprot:3149724-Pleurochrysis_carterae.AAC.2
MQNARVTLRAKQYVQSRLSWYFGIQYGATRKLVLAREERVLRTWLSCNANARLCVGSAKSKAA